MTPKECCIVIFLLYHSVVKGQTPQAASPCTVLSLQASYDNIVVGSGVGGSVSARRLAEFNPSESVLQIERGVPFETCALCQRASDATPASSPTNIAAGRTILTVPQNNLPLNQSIPIIDPAIQGGATAINGLVWVRTNAKYYFDTYWPSLWSWDIMKLFYFILEDYHYPPGFYAPGTFSYIAEDRGFFGNLDETQMPDSPPTSSFINATKFVFPNAPAYHRDSINNGDNPGYGTSPPELSQVDNLRQTSYNSYITTYHGSNLKSISNVRVNKILFTGTKATGVQIVFVDPTTGLANSLTCNVSAKTIVVSAGTLGTPKLLMQSGVGPRATLTKYGIPVVSNLPAVGSNLDDQFVVVAIANSPVPTSQTSPNNLGYLYWNAADTPNKVQVDTYITFSVGDLAPGVSVAAFGVQKLFQQSRGTVTISGSNPDLPPVVDPNYLGSYADKQVLALGLDKALKVIRKMNLTLLVDPCAAGANPQCATKEGRVDAYVNAGLDSAGYHFTATARINDVVDSSTLRVKGTSGLYVVDASIMPLTPGGNPQATVYAVSERAIELVQFSKLGISPPSI